MPYENLLDPFQYFTQFVFGDYPATGNLINPVYWDQNNEYIIDMGRQTYSPMLCIVEIVSQNGTIIFSDLTANGFPNPGSATYPPNSLYSVVQSNSAQKTRYKRLVVNKPYEVGSGSYQIKVYKATFSPYGDYDPIYGQKYLWSKGRLFATGSIINPAPAGYGATANSYYIGISGTQFGRKGNSFSITIGRNQNNYDVRGMRGTLYFNGVSAGSFLWPNEGSGYFDFEPINDSGGYQYVSGGVTKTITIPYNQPVEVKFITATGFSPTLNLTEKIMFIDEIPS